MGVIKSFHLIAAKGTARGKARGWLLKLEGKVVGYFPVMKKEAIECAREVAEEKRPSQLTIFWVAGKKERDLYFTSGARN